MFSMPTAAPSRVLQTHSLKVVANDSGQSTTLSPNVFPLKGAAEVGVIPEDHQIEFST